MISLARAPALSTETQRLTGRRRQKRNRRMLASNPLCVTCQMQGRVAAATQLDHVIPLHLGGPDDESNLQGLCDDCHETKTKAEAAARC
jgi:5-methylcytosine-specific restriction protein A